jgi:hypothetical protein
VARLKRSTRAVIALLLTGVILSSCGVGAAVSDARTSCKYVHKALELQMESERPGLSTRQQNTLRNDAEGELLKGTQSAANATSIDGSWNALQTTINEAERVPLPDLVASLTRICQVADSSSPYLGG